MSSNCGRIFVYHLGGFDDQIRRIARGGDHGVVARHDDVAMREELMISRIHARAEQRVPRYTSYPTAPNFSAAITADHQAAWLSMLPKSAPLSFYIHVPFCSYLCHYCGCHTKAVRKRTPIDVYADRLAEEFAIVARCSGSRRVTHLHWGGGTPSYLGTQRIAELAAKLNDVFDLAPGREHVFELDPRYVTRNLAHLLSRLGVTRASLGVQDFTAHVQSAIGRVQPFTVVKRAVLALREFGIGRINFDLMYGLPRQSDDDIRCTVDLAASLEPQRVAYFGYAHVPWFKPHQRLIDEAALPGALERLKQAETARAALTACGYEAIGLDHFARPDDDLAMAARYGRLRRNFQGYTTDDAAALIGFGASAISRFPQGFVQNSPDASGYARAILSDRLATARGIALSAEDRVRGRIIERLMCDFAVDLDAIAGDRGIAPDFGPERDEIARLEAEGLALVNGSAIKVTERGRPFVRLVAATFDAYWAKTRTRHAVAV
jgi:oxygen-independent coproporphyrinogen-3 oxidase